VNHAGPTTSDAHILVDGVEVFGSKVNANNPRASFSRTLSVNAGTTIDFSVGGDVGNAFNDDTGLFVSIAGR
jgi:hypothetical protein